LVLDFVDLLPDIPVRTARVHHDVDVMDAIPPIPNYPGKTQVLEGGSRIHDGQWHHAQQ